jgi:hypothetical protein
MLLRSLGWTFRSSFQVRRFLKTWSTREPRSWMRLHALTYHFREVPFSPQTFLSPIKILPNLLTLSVYRYIKLFHKRYGIYSTTFATGSTAAIKSTFTPANFPLKILLFKTSFVCNYLYEPLPLKYFKIKFFFSKVSFCK